MCFETDIFVVARAGNDNLLVWLAQALVDSSSKLFLGGGRESKASEATRKPIQTPAY